MALSTIQREIKAAVTNYTDVTLRNKLGSTYVHDIRITSESSSVAFQQGVINVMIAMGMDTEEQNYINREFNTTFNWKNVINTIYNRLDKVSGVVETNHSLQSFEEFLRIKPSKGIYLLAESNKDNIIIRLYNDSSQYTGDVGLKKFLEAFREEAWKTWVKTKLGKGTKLDNVSLESKLPPKTEGAKTGASVRATFGRGSPFAHDSQTAVGTFGLERIVADLGNNQDFMAAVDTLNTFGVTTNIINNVKKSLKLTFEREIVVMPDGSEKEVRVIRGEIRKQKKEAGDWTNIKSQILGSRSKKIKGSLPEFLESAQAKIAAFDGQKAIDADGSKTYRQRAAEQAGAKIVESFKKNKKAKVVKKKEVKKPRNKTESIDINVGSGAQSQVTKNQILSIAAGQRARKKRAEKRTEKGKKLSLTKLRADINRSLGAEMRRNMGRPALINRTGRFSNSAMVTNIVEGPNTLIGEYTYQLDPYSTFENTGEKRWPVGYNPKPLIAKSIRNLALKYTEQKFTLRRV